MRPVFVFGTGRCGSTHLQRLISLNTDVWVWGEHDAVLVPLLNAVSRFEASRELHKNLFSKPTRSDEELLDAMTRGLPVLPWLNRWDGSVMRREVGFTIDRLFRTPLPEGWTEWGFKEIRYGHGNTAPEMLLDLFPGAAAAFTFRHPKMTVESMVRSWDTHLLADERRLPDLKTALSERAARWRTVMLSFIALNKRHNERLTFVPVQALDLAPDAILDRLGLRPRKEAAGPAIALTNRGGRPALPDWAQSAADEIYEMRRADLEEVFREAMDIGCGELEVDLADHQPSLATT